jgi:hypothetical protein
MIVISAIYKFPSLNLIFSFASASCKEQCIGHSNGVLEAKAKGKPQKKKYLFVSTALHYITLRCSANIYHLGLNCGVSMKSIGSALPSAQLLICSKFEMRRMLLPTCICWAYFPGNNPRMHLVVVHMSKMLMGLSSPHLVDVV